MAPPSRGGGRSRSRSRVNLNWCSHCSIVFLLKVTILSGVVLVRPGPEAWWELLHLLLVGIAVSYGLLSRRAPHFPISDAHDSLSDLSIMLFHVPSSSFQASNYNYNSLPLGLPLRTLKSHLHANANANASTSLSLSVDHTQFQLETANASASLSSDFTNSIVYDLRYKKMEITEEMGHAHETQCESPSDASFSSNATSSYSSSNDHSPSHSQLLHSHIQQLQTYARKEPTHFVNVGRHVEGRNVSSRGKSVTRIRHSEWSHSRDAYTKQSDDKSGNMLNGDEEVERMWKQDHESQEDVDVDGHVLDWSDQLVGRARSVGPGEVDKKADEFIAKFREQIRLQKTASIHLSASRDLNIHDNYFT